MLKSLLEWMFLVPTITGSVYVVLCLIALWRFHTRPPKTARKPFVSWPPVTMLKPVHGLEKNQRENLRSACLQDYPLFQVVFSVQTPDDPAVPLLREIQREFGPESVTVVIGNRRAGSNGKINNMLGGLRKRSSLRWRIRKWGVCARYIRRAAPRPGLKRWNC